MRDEVTQVAASVGQNCGELEEEKLVLRVSANVGRRTDDQG